MRKKFSAKRRLEFESLEDRAMLTGTVRTALVNGQLQITGDNSSNLVSVTANGSVWTVKGDDTAISGATTFTGVTSLSAKLLKGDDSLTISRGTMTGAIDVSYTAVDTGTKSTLLSFVTAGRVSVANAASGDNTVTFSQVTTFVTSFHGIPLPLSGGNGILVNTAGGNDTIQLSGVNSAANLQVLAGNGNNFVILNGVQTISGDNNITTGTGTDSIVVSSFQGSNLTVKSGAATDHVVLNAVNLKAGGLFVDVGPGTGDVITASNNRAGTAFFRDTGGTGGLLTLSNNSFGVTIIGPNITATVLSTA